MRFTSESFTKLEGGRTGAPRRAADLTIALDRPATVEATGAASAGRLDARRENRPHQRNDGIEHDAKGGLERLSAALAGRLAILVDHPAAVLRAAVAELEAILVPVLTVVVDVTTEIIVAFDRFPTALAHQLCHVLSPFVPASPLKPGATPRQLDREEFATLPRQWVQVSYGIPPCPRCGPAVAVSSREIGLVRVLIRDRLVR